MRRGLFFFVVVIVLCVSFIADASTATKTDDTLAPPSIAVHNAAAGETPANIESAALPSEPAPAVPGASAPAGRTPANPVAAASSLNETTQLIVNFLINTQPRGDFFVEMDDKKNLFVKVEDVKALELKFDANQILTIGEEKYIPLDALLDVTSSFDEKKLMVSVIGKTLQAGNTAVDLFPVKSSSKQSIYYPREASAFLNYGLAYAYTSADGFQSFAVTNKLGLRAGDVFFTSDSLYTKTPTNDNFVRLQSSATYERRGDLQWLVLGDQYANSGDLGSTTNMSGIGFSKVYKLDPYFITQPVMDLKGSVIFPTQAEIYMDGVLIGKQAITPGSFELKNLYSSSGSHNIEVLLRDPFGNVQKIYYPAYFSAQLLRQGLHEYSYNVGFQREQYGVESNDYGNVAFSAFHRYGVTNDFNIGARAEGAAGLYNGGLYTGFTIPHAGAFSVSFAGSAGNGYEGLAGSFQHFYQRGSFSTNLLFRGYSRDYMTAADPLGAILNDSTQFEFNAGCGFLIDRFGSLSLNYAENDMFSGTYTHALSANYSRVLTRAVSLFATASATWTTEPVYSAFIGLNINFAPNVRGSAQYSRSGDTNIETLQVQKDIPVGEGLGYRASLNRSETPAQTTTSVNPFVQYNARYGIYSVDATVQYSSNRDTAELYNLSAAGSLVYAGGFIGLARPVSDSFGIVKVDNIAGATIRNNGQEIGKTGSSGTLVVPSLTSYGRNQISVDTKNIPIDYSISDVNRLVSPSLWSGSCIAFEARQIKALTGTLVAQKEGKKAPLEYVEISIKADKDILTFPTGKGGEFYIENTLPEEQKTDVDKFSCSAIAERRASGGNIIKPGTYTATVEYEGGKCEFSVTFPENAEAITDVGEILCVGASSAAPASVSTPSLAPVAPETPAVAIPKEQTAETPSVPAPETPVTPAVQPLPAAPVVAPPEAEKKPEKVSFILNVHFEDSKAVIRKQYHHSIERLANFMKAHPETTIEIIGHTDNAGKEGYDILLSQKWADSVQKYLKDNFGIEKSRMTAFGYGASQPIADNKTKAGRQKNRRVEIVISGLVNK